MGFWTLVQILFDISVVFFGVIVLIKLNRPAKDDPRLSRGLQLLQSKISILEDLADRTDTQVMQIQTLLNQKAKDLQDQMAKAEIEMSKIQQATQRSLEVAKIFQDKIPHKEIIERQNTLKYVKAAKLAHQGKSVEEIAKQVDLSYGELELIAKVNRQQLQFAEEALPDWAQEELKEINRGTASHSPDKSSQAGPLKKEHIESLEDSWVETSANPIGVESADSQEEATAEPNSLSKIGEQIRKYEFPKVDVNSMLSSQN